MNEKLGSLDKIAETLGTTFEMQEIEKINTDLKKYEKAKVDIGSLMFEDQVEIREGLKDVINRTKGVMEKLDADILIGTSPYAAQVISLLTTSLVNCYKELTSINSLIFEAKLKTNQLQFGDIKKDDKIELTSEQLTNLIDSAKKNSSMNNIEVKFDVGE